MPEMKNSGIDWIGEIPIDWDLMRLQFCLKEVNVKNNPIQTTQVLSLMKDIGVLPYEEKGDVGNKSKENISEYHLAYPNTIVLNCMNILIGSVGISKYFGCVSPVYYVFKETDKSDLRFINYIFNTRELQKELRKYAKGILEIRLRVSADDIFKRKVPLPNKDEQIRIANFLDEKCAEIDNLVSDLQSQIDVLDEYKKAVITETVVKGLNPNAEMKFSGIDWIGEIPKKWSTAKITHILDYRHSYPIGDGDHGTIKATEYIEDGIPFLRVQNLGFATELSLEDVVYISEECNKRIANSTLRPGDILFAKTGATIGKTAIIPDNLSIANTTSHVGKITVSPKYDNKYMYYLLSSNVGYRQFWEMASMKSTRPELSIDEIKRIKVIIPNTKAEQTAIANYLDTKCSEIDTAILDKRTQIETLADYKKSLIYEYVTGKKQVKENA